jgi:hypothetical protein
VPLIVYDPRTGTRGKRIPNVVRDVDIAPTLYELAGVEAPSDLDGRWWVEWISTRCTTEAELASWVRDRSGDECTEEESYGIMDFMSRLGFFSADEDDKFLCRKMSDNEWEIAIAEGCAAIDAAPRNTNTERKLT